MTHPNEKNGKIRRLNQTLKLLINRGSCRSFSNKKISPEVLQLILEAGIHAPTGGDLQPYSIIKIEDDKTKQKLVEIGMQKFVAKAPVLLLFCIDWRRIERWANLSLSPFTATKSFRHFWISLQDTTICAQNICTAADSLGLGSVYIGTVIHMPVEIKILCKLPKGVCPVILVCLGYPKSKILSKKKLGVNVIVHSEYYQDMKADELMKSFNDKYQDSLEKINVTDKRLEKIYKVCKEAHGIKFANKCIKHIKDNGYINTSQYYFGLRYLANIMPKSNETLLKLMETWGFSWFKKYQPI